MKRRFAFATLIGSIAAVPVIVTTAQQPVAEPLASVVFQDAASVVTTAVDVPQQGRFHPSRVLVRFQDGAQPDFLPGSPFERDFPGDPNLHLVQNPPGLSVAEAVRNYRGNPNVLYAEPDYVVTTNVIPTDPQWKKQWDMMKIAAPSAWDTQTDSSTVVVAIIDTGIDFTHPDLQANLWVSADGSHGFTCMSGRCVTGGSDDFGHGTHVAGTIGAVAQNGIGMAGINWRVQLMSLKFLDSNGSGAISDAVLAFDQVTALKQQGVNVRLTSNSWGSTGFSQSLKDAVARGEAAGILHVCAAGNSNQNADASPMYPAAYDNPGIISVLASDQNDMGATFTNYGLAGVDIAAPGVSTFSTVPRATCKLCDPSGYKLLSGTSMATPHVSGVLAALFHENPALTPNQARDVILDAQSYDTLADTKARSSSTGGRLNFAKTLANPLLFAPVPNNFPVVDAGPNVFAPAGSQVSLAATAYDADNDSLRMAWYNAGIQSKSLFNWMLQSIFPSTGGSSLSFTAPSVARTTTVPYAVSVADGRGGSAQGLNYVTVAAAPNAGLPLSGALSVSPTDAKVGSTVTVSFPTTAQGPVAWDLWAATKYIVTGACCFTSSSASVIFNTAGVYRIATQAIDSALNLSARQSVVVRIGGATGEPPIAAATLDKLSGPAPLKVDIDMSASVDPDGGRIPTYLFGCEEGSLIRSRKAQGSCTFTTPGVHWIKLLVQDSSGYVDQVSAYVVVTP